MWLWRVVLSSFFFFNWPWPPCMGCRQKIEEGSKERILTWPLMCKSSLLAPTVDLYVMVCCYRSSSWWQVFSFTQASSRKTQLMKQTTNAVEVPRKMWRYIKVICKYMKDLMLRPWRAFESASTYLECRCICICICIEVVEWWLLCVAFIQRASEDINIMDTPPSQLARKASVIQNILLTRNKVMWQIFQTWFILNHCWSQIFGNRVKHFNSKSCQQQTKNIEWNANLLCVQIYAFALEDDTPKVALSTSKRCLFTCF